MVERHTVEIPHHDPSEIPEENVERHGDDRLSVFEWYCPDCEAWLGWPQHPTHAAVFCGDLAACTHTDDGADACDHVVCGECQSLADSHEWVLDGEQAGRVARQIFDDEPDVETAFRKALLEDLQQVTEGASVEEIVRERQDLFEEYVRAVEAGADGDE